MKISFRFIVAEFGPLLLLPIILTLASSFITYAISSEEYIDKTVLNKNIKQAIINKADLETIEYIFKYQRGSLIKGSLNDPPEQPCYEKDVSLEHVLRAIIAEEYLEGSPENVIDETNSLLQEKGKKDPFTHLDAAERLYFTNIQKNSGGAYKDIESDVNMIAEMFQSKNRLVSEYLADSTKSYYISIFSVVLSILFTLIQSVTSWLRRRNS